MDDNNKQYIAELLGTFTLVFIGAGAGALAGPEHGNIGLLGVAVAHGVALLVIAYAWGSVSGAHVNPAITASLALTGKISWSKAVMYWIAQFLGAAAAAFLLRYLIGGDSLGQTTGSLTDADPVKTVVVEAVLTFFLGIAVFASGVEGKNGNAVGVAIGLVLTMDILMGGSLTGASMNPARTFGPALAAGKLGYLWMYIVGPVIGACGAGLLYQNLFLASAPAENAKESRKDSKRRT